MAKSPKEQHLPEARALYAEGASKATIAEALPVSLSTIRRWAREDAAAGRPWTRDAHHPSACHPTCAAAACRTHGPQDDGSLAERLCRKLEERLERLIEDNADDVENTRLEDHMLKICKVLDFLRAGRDDLGAQLLSMKRFAAFCIRNLSEQEMTPVRRAIRLFIEELRKDNA